MPGASQLFKSQIKNGFDYQARNATPDGDAKAAS
jgi:hypothetical protein